MKVIHFIMEIQALEGWQITFVRRKGNQVAHLVKHDFKTTWGGMPPNYICDTLLLEKFTLVS
jgi:hypothetical protein